MAATHRDAAVAACREAIDAVKSHVPIWKHKDYADGGSEWLQPGVRFAEAQREEPHATVVMFEDLYGNRWGLLQPRDAAEATAPKV